MKHEINDMIKCQPYLSDLIYVVNANCEITVPSTCKVNKKSHNKNYFYTTTKMGNLKYIYINTS